MSSQTVGSQRDLAVQLEEWAIKEMRFRPKGQHVNSRLPSAQDFRPLCRGQMNDVWKFLISRVHSAQTVRKVQGNLSLKAQQLSQEYKVRYQSDSQYDHQLAALQERHRQLATELTACLTAMGHVEKDVQCLQKDIITKEKLSRECSARIRDTQRRAALLSAHSHHVHNTAEQYREYAQRMTLKAEKLLLVARRKPKDQPRLTSQDSEEEATVTDRLQTACTNDIKGACSVIGDFLNDLLQGKYGTNKNVISERKQELWQKVENVLSDHAVHQILVSMCAYSQDTVLSLREMTSQIDIKKDAEALRFKYEQHGELSDVSTPPNVISNMHNLLQESQVTGIYRFVETEKHKNLCHRLDPRMTQALSVCHTHLGRRYSKDPGALQLAKNILNCQLQSACSRTALHVLTESSQELMDRIAKATKEKDVIYSKYKQIQGFKKIADGKQNLIRVLVKQNVQAQPKLEEQRKEILQYIQNSLGSHSADIHSLTDQLKNGVRDEVEAFTALALPYLVFTMLNSAFKLAVLDLSIHRLESNKATPGGQVLEKMLQVLEFAPYQAPECLLPHIVRLQSEVCEIEATLDAQKELALQTESDDNTHTSVAKHITDLSEEVKRHDDRQLEKILPTLQHRLAAAAKALTDCLQVKDTLQHWWDQPAQTSVPWVTVDQLSLQQWRDKWTVAVTRLRQINLQA